ncbi:MAG: hypothetical protein ACM3UL_02345 [Ignavibacteria bacterium]
MQSLRGVLKLKMPEKKQLGSYFDPVALLQRAGQIHEAQHPTLGLICYGELVIADSEIINKCKNKADRNAMSIYLMLKKAYPNLPDYTLRLLANLTVLFQCWKLQN